MTQNPFDNLGADNPFGGGGGFDLNALMEQAQQMQAQLQEAQERLADGRVHVTAAAKGGGELVAVDIKAGGFDGSDPDDLSDLGDMIVAACRDAKAQADA